MYSEDLENEEEICDCEETCDCEDACDCGEECHHEEGCHCGGECHCHDDGECHCGHGKDEYLDLARQIQADFENFRRHAIEDIKKARIDGQVSVIEAFLPCLDIFKEAKKAITDENVLKGVEMVENKIISSLENLGVKKVESIGKVYDPVIHNVIAVIKDEELENDVIVDEYQAGYEFNGKIIRDAKVIVNKKED